MTTTYIFSNNATTTLAANISSTTTVINLSQGTGALFPSPNADEQFAVTLVDAQTGLNNEICYCTSRSGDALTVIRGQENTTATNWSAGDTAANYLTAGTIQNWLQQSDLQPYSDSIAKAITASGQTLDLTDTTQLTSAIKVLGNIPVWSQSVSNLIGGYPARFVVQDPNTENAFWVSTASNNTTTPGASGASWTSLFAGLTPTPTATSGSGSLGVSSFYTIASTGAVWASSSDTTGKAVSYQLLNLSTSSLQTVTGPVTFSVGPTVPTAAFGTSTKQAASTEFATKMKPGRLLGVFSVGGSATYFPPRQDASVLFRVRATGAGGGGAPVPSYGTYVMGAAGGGASGSYAEMWFTWAQLMNTTSTGGAAIAVIVGKGGTSGNAGGATTVGNALVCPGGSQGGSANGGSYSSLSAGGSSGGACTMPNGTWSYGINFPGQGGGPGIVQNPQQGGTSFGISGSGGSTPFGSGAGGVGSSNTQGANGLVGWVGGGGSGACSGRVTSGTTTAQTGGTGGDGWVIIECYEAISA